MKFGCRRKSFKGRAAIRHYANQPNFRQHSFQALLDRADTWRQINPSSKEINSPAAAGDGGVLLTWTTPIINNQDPDRPLVAVVAGGSGLDSVALAVLGLNLVSNL